MLLSALEIEKPALKDKLLPTDALIDACIIELNHIVLKLDVLLCIILEVFKISKESVSVTIKFLIKVSSLWHVANNLSEVWNI